MASDTQTETYREMWEQADADLRLQQAPCPMAAACDQIRKCLRGNATTNELAEILSPALDECPKTPCHCRHEGMMPPTVDSMLNAFPFYRSRVQYVIDELRQNVLTSANIMNSPFDRLNVDRQLACEFLAVFARYEFALKAAGFASGDDRKVDPAWDAYARAIDGAFAQLNSPELAAAVDYLINQPPKKQVLVGGNIQWRDAPPDPNTPRAEQVLLIVRRVRNNLFHGGKFLPGGDRDQELVSHALFVLRACLPLHATVAAAFET